MSETCKWDAIIALGSNLGNRRQSLETACSLMNESGIDIVRRSRIYESRAWGVTDQPDFFNAAVVVQTELPPGELLFVLLGIENTMGRRRESKWGPRLIDLDLLLYGDLHVQSLELTLPHPEIARRDFVLLPLIDLAVEPERWQALLDRLPAEARTIMNISEW